MIRKATEEDLSRIAEIFVFNNRINYFPIFKSEEYSFGELQVVSLIEKYFGKTLWDLAFSLTWGGYLPNDVQIAKDLGLGYGVYKTSNIYGKSTHYEYLDYEFTECDEISSMKALTEYFTQNISVINRIVDLFEKDMPAKGYTFI